LIPPIPMMTGNCDIESSGAGQRCMYGLLV
jgi:hypothetical protein